MEGLQRQLAKPVKKKEPVTVDMLDAMVKDAEAQALYLIGPQTSNS